MSREHPLILQLTASGIPTRWMTYEDAAYYIAKDLVAWTASESNFTIYGGENRVTGSQSSMDIATIMAVKGEMGDKGLFRVPTLTNRSLFRRDQNVCAYCGQEFKNEDLTRDHVLPRSRSGPDKWTNCVTACGGCNKYKDDKTPEEADMKLLYVPYAPSRAEYLILMNRNILADQMEFLMKQVSKDSRLHNPIKKLH